MRIPMGYNRLAGSRKTYDAPNERADLGDGRPNQSTEKEAAKR